VLADVDRDDWKDESRAEYVAIYVAILKTG
jgi:hypothetical protein